MNVTKLPTSEIQSANHRARSSGLARTAKIWAIRWMGRRMALQYEGGASAGGRRRRDPGPVRRVLRGVRVSRTRHRAADRAVFVPPDPLPSAGQRADAAHLEQAGDQRDGLPG